MSDRAMTHTSTHNSPTPDSPVTTDALWSPNHGVRKNDRAVDILMLHYTGMNDNAAALRLLCDPQAEVSCHYFVDEAGNIIQMVPESRRAWHAGDGSWGGDSDVNSRSIGIEIANRGHNYPERDAEPPPFPEAQIAAVIRLSADIVKRRNIAPQHVLAHSDTAPQRKRDPGEKFPWRRLFEAGIGLWVPPEPLIDGRIFSLGDESPPVAALQAMLATYGYGITVTGRYDDILQTIVAAFQRHFRPQRIDGVADYSTIATLRRLIAAIPHDDNGLVPMDIPSDGNHGYRS